jgi:DNA-binding GntR family transcriptional regulator
MTDSVEAAVAPQTRQVARHAVRNHIAHMVLTNQVAPGEKLVQQNLAKKLGVSRSVVREALFELGGMGLVDTHDNRGGVVSPLCGQFVLEALEVREMLEALVARRCCSNMTRAQIAELTEMAHEIFRQSNDGQRVEAAMLDRQFHLRLMQYSANSLQIRMSESFWFTTKVIRGDRRDYRDTLAGHLEILAAIEAGDEDRAEAAIRAHIRAARKDAEEALKLPASQVHWVIDPPEEALRSVSIRKESPKP